MFYQNFHKSLWKRKISKKKKGHSRPGMREFSKNILSEQYFGRKVFNPKRILAEKYKRRK